MENKNVYVGHRYVPKIMGEHDKTQSYEGLSIVTHEGTSYTSKKRVPVGVDISNSEYWVVTGNYNAQIEEYRNDVKYLKEHVNDTVDNITKNVNDEIENITKNVNDEIENVNINIDKNKTFMSDLIFNKKIKYSLPVRFKDYYNVNNGYGLYPQQLFISEKDEKIYIQYANKGNKSNVIVVYNLSGEYDRCFLINEYGYEGINVRHVSGKRLLYVNDDYGTIHEYDITNMPENKSLVLPSKSTELNYTFRYGYNPINDKYLFQHSPDGFYFDFLNNEYEKINHLSLKGLMKQIAKRPTKNKRPFIQSFTFDSNFIFFGVGRLASNNSGYEGWNELTQQGLIITDHSGNIVNHGMLDPNKMRKILENKGYNIEMLENEGVCITESNKVYSLFTTTWGTSKNNYADNEGILIFEEFYSGKDNVNFEEAKMEIYGYDNNVYHNSFYPTDKPNVINNVFYHPVTKEPIDSIKDIMNYMMDYNIEKLDLVKTGNMKLKSGDGSIKNHLILFKIFKVSNTMLIVNEISYQYETTYSYIPSTNSIDYFNTKNINTTLLEEVTNVQKGDIYNLKNVQGYHKKIKLSIEFHGNLKIVELDFKNQDYIHTALNLSDTDATTISLLEMVIRIKRNSIEIIDIRLISKNNNDEWSKPSEISGIKIVKIEGSFD